MDSQQESSSGALPPTSPNPNSVAFASSDMPASDMDDHGEGPTSSANLAVMSTDNGLVMNFAHGGNSTGLASHDEDQEDLAKMDTNHNSSQMVDHQQTQGAKFSDGVLIESEKSKTKDVDTVSETMSNGVAEDVDAAMASEGDSDSLREFTQGKM